MHEKLPKTLWPFIWHFLRHYKLPTVIFVALALIAGVWGPFNSLLIKNVINLVPTAQGNISILGWPVALIVLNFMIFDNLTWRTIAYIRYKYHPVIINQIVKEMMDFTLTHSNQFFQDNFSGQILKQITNLADGIQNIINDILANFLRGGSLLITAFITAYFVNPIFCGIFIVWFIIFASVSIIMSRKLVLLSDREAATESSVVGQLLDAITNQNNIRMFAKKDYEVSRMDGFFAKQLSAFRARELFAIILHSMQGGMIAVMMGACVYTLVYLYGQGLLTIGDFALILGLAMELGHMMWYTMSCVDDYNKSAGRCRQSLNALAIEHKISDKIHAKALIVKSSKITFDKVKFHYKDIKPLFEDKTITIEPGQKVGLVGYSGSGKSTFVNLIMRLFDVSSGSISIDGQDIRDVTQNSLHNSIAIIPQDPSLFHRSIMENIRYGKVDANDKEVMSAAKAAGAHEFIESLSDKYHTLVGERGIKLSGGQRQRIAIARAFLKNAQVLILDEATSQLDSITEEKIQESLIKLMKGKTTIVVAHRLSTLLHMDRILVFDKGKIVEDGTHKSLLKQKGLYKTLWDAQVGGFLPSRQK